MKDDKLENTFAEYFDGVNPPQNMTDGAKKYLKRKNAVWTKLSKTASVAAGFALVFAAALGIILYSSNSDALPAVPDKSKIQIYGDESLSFSDENAYSIDELNASLKFLKQFARGESSTVYNCRSGYSVQNELVLVKAEVGALYNNSRHDATVYVEFGQPNYVYSGLESFFDGAVYSYRGTSYMLSETVAENGEPQFKLYFTFNKIKYYFDILSSDKNCYTRYLEAVVK